VAPGVLGPWSHLAPGEHTGGYRYVVFRLPFRQSGLSVGAPATEMAPRFLAPSAAARYTHVEW